MRVLVVTSGDATGINFCRSLRAHGGYSTIGVDTTVEDYLTSEADTSYLLPHPSRGPFFEALQQLIAEQDVDLVYAADTNVELDLIFEERDKLGAPVFLPRAEDRIAEDKWQTWCRLSAAGVPVHANALAATPGDLRAFFRKHRPVWLRRARGSGGAGSVATDDYRFARAWIDHHHGWGAFLVAELLTRKMATWIGVWWEGALQVCQMRERIGWKYQNLSPSGVTGITAVQRTMWDPSLHALALQCVHAVSDHPHGILSVDFTWGFDGVPKPTEIQPSRFYSSIHFLTAAGLNLPALYCQIAVGGPLSTPLINPIREEVYWVKSVDTPGKLVPRAEWDAIELYAPTPQ